MASKINISLEIERLIQYGLSKKFIDFGGSLIARNSLLDLLKARTSFKGPLPQGENLDLNDILNKILQYCYEQGLLPDATLAQRDLMSARIMGIITPSPAEVSKRFKMAYITSPMEATDYLYNLCVDVDYIKSARGKKNFFWDNEEPYGRLELTNNFQETERTPDEIEKRNLTKKYEYPACEICLENVGFAGNLWHPAKQNLRVVTLELAGRSMFLQYTPEQYYGERFILTDCKHQTHELSKKDFEIMLSFLDSFPHCFISVDSDLPGLGNRFPQHTHYQGGCSVFPIDNAEVAIKFTHEIYKNVEAGILNWPVSTIRIECDDAGTLAEAMNFITSMWKGYTDEDAEIFAYNQNAGEKIPQNSISAVIRKSSYGSYEADIALRNNRKTLKCPNGVFAHSKEHRHMSRNNFGIIEIMGLGVYPGSFDSELLHIMSYVMMGRNYQLGQKPSLDKHYDWINQMVNKYKLVDNYEAAKSVILFETSRKFARMLESYGVFKMTDEGLDCFKTFMDSIGFIETQY